MAGNLDQYLYERYDRWWADLRKDSGHLGGGREAMKTSGASYATKDREVALKLLGKRLEELHEAERRRSWRK